MTTLEMIQAELGNVPPERLGELYAIVRTFATAPEAAPGNGIMERLGEIRFQGPADFSTNLDLYLSGEKSLDENIH